MVMPTRRRPEVPLPPAPPIGAVDEPPVAWPEPPSMVLPERRGPSRGRSAAVLAWLGGALAVSGAFLPWARYADGFERAGTRGPGGWVAVGLGVLAAGLGGARWARTRHGALRLAILAVGVALLVLTISNRVSIGLEDARGRSGAVRASYGLLLTFLGGVSATVGGVLDDAPIRLWPKSAPEDHAATV